MDEQFMRKKAVLPLITSMALPMVLSMLVNALYNIVDSYFVARISENAMTALSLVYPLQNLVNAIAIGFGVGISAVIALYLGAGKQKRADQAATQGMLWALVHGVLLTGVCIAIIPLFLQAFTKDRAVIDLGVRYVVVTGILSRFTLKMSLSLLTDDLDIELLKRPWWVWAWAAWPILFWIRC